MDSKQKQIGEVFPNTVGNLIKDLQKYPQDSITTIETDPDCYIRILSDEEVQESWGRTVGRVFEGLPLNKLHPINGYILKNQVCHYFQNLKKLGDIFGPA